jgi:hypothetical protein
MPSLESVLTHGEVTWVVCCPVCEHNSVHTCDIETKQEVVAVPEVPVAMPGPPPDSADMPW